MNGRRSLPMVSMESAEGIAKWRIGMAVIGVLMSLIGVLVSVILTLQLQTSAAAAVTAKQATELAAKANQIASLTSQYNQRQDYRMSVIEAQAEQAQRIQQHMLDQLAAMDIRMTQVDDALHLTPKKR